MTWLLNNLGRVGELLATHTLLALSAIVAAAVLSVPLGRLAVGSRSIGGVVLSALALLYAVPSLPMLVVIPVILGIPVRSPLNMVIVLTLYGIAVLITQVAEAFRSLPRDVIEAANALGIDPWRRFWQVELPLAVPVLVAGLRVVAASTVSLGSVARHAVHRRLSAAAGRILADGPRRDAAAGPGLRPNHCAGRQAPHPVASQTQGDEGMNIFLDALAWLVTPDKWAGASGIWWRLLQHLGFTLAVVAVASVVALPAGVAIGHTRRGVAVVPMVTASARALPTLGLLTLVGLWSGLGLVAPFLALLVLAIPPMLAGAYAGVTSAEAATVDAARAIGLSPWQVLTQVELPAAVPLLLEGLRSTTLQVVATATLAAYTADVGLGRFLFAGLKTRDYAQMIGGALLVVVLALVLDLLLVLAKRSFTRTLDPSTKIASVKESR